MDLKYRVRMLAEIQKVRPLTKAEIKELKEYRRDIISLSLIAYQARDWDWLHEICANLGEVDSLLWLESLESSSSASEG
jgi:hypothetical protein